MLEPLKKLLTLLPRADRWKLLALFVLMLIGTGFELLGIGMIPLFVSAVAEPDFLLENERIGPLLEWAGITTSRSLLIYGGVALFVVFLVRGMYMIWLHYRKAKFVQNRFASIAGRLYESYLYAPYSFHLGRNTAEIIRNVTTETALIARGIMTPMLLILMDLTVVIGIFALLLVVEPVITLVAFVLIGGVGGLILKLLKGGLRRFGKSAARERQRMIQAVQEGLGGIKDVIVLNRRTFFVRKFQNFVRNFAKAQVFREVASKFSKPAMELVAVTGMIAISFMLIWQGRSMSAVIGVLVLFATATARLMPKISSVINQSTTLRYNIYALRPVYADTQLLKEHRQSFDPQRVKNKLPFTRSIVLDNLCYSYPNAEESVLKHIDLEIPKGAAVAFAGSTGAGKTTIVDVILGLLDPVEGRILVDGVDIAGHTQEWQNNVGYIPQFIYLSDDTIRSNIAFGLPEEEISEEKVEAAVDAAQLDEMVDRLSEGLDTVIGERGVRLSGGQRQRVGIARALYDNPDVLIMDEATSSLDNFTEKQVISSIEALKGERTIIMIAHRLTTVKNCDTLYLMKDGEIADSGTYDELVRHSREFREMSLHG